MSLTPRGPASRADRARGSDSPQPAPRSSAAENDSLPLVDRYDGLVLDLDGVVHRGDAAISSAPATLEMVRDRGVPIVFLTNNSARTPEQVTARLVSMGIPARTQEVLTSALATADMLERDGMSGSDAFVIGEDGIRSALGSIGIRVLDGEPERADLVVVGWDRSADYSALRTASLLVERGARLVATNADRSFPAADGLWPGAGALLAAITTTTGATPTVVGKPARPMFEAARRMVGATMPLMVGDRLDTDIGGAAGAGWDSMLVLSGASTPADLPGAPALPTFVARDIAAVARPRIRARFRPAVEADASALAALLLSLGIVADHVVDGGGWNGRTVVGAAAAASTGPAGAEPRTADDDQGVGDHGGSERIVATATLVSRTGGDYLRSVAVGTDARGQGLGLLVVSMALRLGDPSRPVYLLTDRAADFFAPLGFRSIDRSDAPRDILELGAQQGCSDASVMMRRAPVGPVAPVGSVAPAPTG